MEEKNLRREILKANRDTIESSTCHGLPNILKTKYVLIKIIWLIFICISGGYCSYSIYQSLSQFFEYQSTTHLETVYKQKQVFPIVKICSLNSNFPNSENQFINYPIESISDVKFFMLNIIMNAKHYKRNIIKKIGIGNLSDILISCKFNLLKCSADDFEYFYDYFFGNCYLFNTGRDMKGRLIPLKKSSQTGSMNGLELEFFVGDSSLKLNDFSYENGINVLISNETDQSLFYDGLRASPGQTTHMAIKKYSMSQLPKPYSNCIADLTSENSYESECYRKTFQRNRNQSKAYHYHDCVYTCIQKFIGNNCNCQDMLIDSYYAHLKKCFNVTEMTCQFNSWTTFLETPTELSVCDCPIECDQSSYSISYSSAEYPTAFYATVLSKNSKIKSKFPNKSDITYDDLRKSMVSVNIYFDDLRETVVSHEVKMTVYDLIAIIGGILGLFLGLSLLSLIEIVEILAQTLIIALTGLVGHKKVIPESKVINIQQNNF